MKFLDTESVITTNNFQLIAIILYDPKKERYHDLLVEGLDLLEEDQIITYFGVLDQERINRQFSKNYTFYDCYDFRFARIKHNIEQKYYDRILSKADNLNIYYRAKSRGYMTQDELNIIKYKCMMDCKIAYEYYCKVQKLHKGIYNISKYDTEIKNYKKIIEIKSEVDLKI